MRSIKVNGRSAFYRTDRQTGNEVFLEERIAACDRDDDDDCHRHTGALFWHRVHVLCRGNAKRRVVCHHLNISLYVIQQSLQGIQLGIADVQGRLEPVVPVTEGEEQGDRCHQRFRQRQGDLSEIWNWVAPSICADSMMDSGMLVLKNVLQITTLNEETQSGRISAQILFSG